MYKKILFLLVFSFLSLIQVTLGEYNEDLNRHDVVTNSSQSVHCLLFKKRQDPCVVIGGKPVPYHLIKLFENLDEHARDVIYSNKKDWNLSHEEFSTLPPTLLMLMSVDRLSQLSGPNLSSIIVSHGSDTSVTAQIVSAVNSTEQHSSFLVSLSMKRNLSDLVQEVIAESVSTWQIDKEWSYLRTVFIGTPLLAHFPPYYLFNSPISVITKFLFFFQSWDKFGKPVWLSKNIITQRVWANLLYNCYHQRLSDWDDTYFNRFWYFLPGMITTQLSDLKNINNINSIINRKDFFKMNFDVEQTQLLFDIFYDNKDELSRKDFIELSHILTKLSPTQLLRFPVNITKFRKPEIILNIHKDDCNFFSSKQITQMLIAQLKLSKDLKSENSSDWGASIKYLGPYIYTLPLHDLFQYSVKPLDTFSLSEMQSSKLSFMQIYYLTGNGTLILSDKPSTVSSLKLMLNAIPASNIRNLDITKITSYIWFMLLSDLPTENIPRSVALLKHVTQLLHAINDLKTLERVLNPGTGNYFKLIPSIILKNISSKISANDLELQHKFSDKIKHFPSNILSLLLNDNRNKSWLWNTSLNETISLEFLIRGLTCYDIDKLETSEFIRVMHQYNKARNEIGQVFPKNLQYCCREKLFKYLSLKSQIMQEDVNEGLMALLEPGDIEAVGGYVLSSVPDAAIEISKYRKQILRSIGKLSLPELMLAVNKSKRDVLIKLSLDSFRTGYFLGNAELLQLKNLITFLSSDDVVNVNPESLKLLLELDYIDKRVCADNKTRSLWSDIVITAFGEPETWTEGVITLIGDFLLVINEEKLNKINKSSWIKIGGALEFHYGNVVEWWLEDVPFYKACYEILDESEQQHYMKDIKKLVKWQLKITQWKLNKIKMANNLLIKYEKPGQLNKNIPSDVLKQLLSLHLVSNNNNNTSIENIFDSENNNKTINLSLNNNEENYNDDDNNENLTPVIKYFTYENKTYDSHSDESQINVSTSTTSSSVFNSNNNYQNLNFEPSIRKFDNISNYESINNFNLETTTVKYDKNLHFESSTAKLNNNSKTESTTCRDNFCNNQTENIKLVDSDLYDMKQNDSVAFDDVPNKFFSVVNDTNNALNEAEMEHDHVPYTIKFNNLNSNEKVDPFNVFEKDTKNITDEDYEDYDDGFGFFNKRDVNKVVLDNINNFVYKTHNTRREPKHNLKKRFVSAINKDFKITCDTLRIVGSMSELVFDKSYIEAMDDIEINDCLEEFGKMNLPYNLKEIIWNKITNRELHLMGSLIQVAGIDDIAKINFDFNQPWILETVQLFSKYIPDTIVVRNMTEKIIDVHNVNKIDPEGLSALSNLLCAMRRIDRNYVLTKSKNDLSLAVAELGKMSNCSKSCISDIATFVMSITNYGSPSNWDFYDVMSLGVIPAGLDNEKWMELITNGRNALMGLHPFAARCLSRDNLRAIPTESFHQMPYKSIIIILKNQYHNLKEDQQVALSNIVNFNNLNITKILLSNVKYSPCCRPDMASSFSVAYFLFITITVTLSITAFIYLMKYLLYRY